VDADGGEVAFHQQLVQLLGPIDRFDEDHDLHQTHQHQSLTTGRRLCSVERHVTRAPYRMSGFLLGAAAGVQQNRAGPISGAPQIQLLESPPPPFPRPLSEGQ